MALRCLQCFGPAPPPPPPLPHRPQSLDAAGGSGASKALEQCAVTLSTAEQLRDKLVRAQQACGETQSMLARLAVEPAAAPAPAPARIAELRTGRGLSLIHI